MNLVVTDQNLADLARQVGSPFYSESVHHLWDIALDHHVTGLTYLRKLSSPGSFETLAADALHRDVLLMKTLSLMSDMWDIPLFVTLWGGPKLMPTTESGVYWALLEDAVHARKARIVRTNGLFGPHISNDVLRALASENPTFDSYTKISPLHQQQLLTEIEDWVTENTYREMPPKSVFLGNRVSMTWYQVASSIMVGARPWDNRQSFRRGKYRSVSHFERMVVFDDSWETHRLEDITEPWYKGNWRKEFAAIAKGWNHDLVNEAKDLFFV